MTWGTRHPPELGQASGKDVIMSPAQAKELLASVDEVMGFAAKDTGLAGVRACEAAAGDAGGGDEVPDPVV